MTDIFSPGRNAALFLQAERAVNAGRTAAGLELATAAVTARPSFFSLERLAVLQERAGQLSRARKTLLRAAAIYPANSGLARLQLGLIEARAGHYDEATQLLEQYVGLYPRDGYVLYQLGSVLALQRRFAEANALFERGVLVRCGDLKRTTTRVIRFPVGDDAGSIPVPLVRQVRLNEAPGISGDVGAIYFISCDPRYFERFAEAVINSLAARSDIKIAIHIHLINPDEPTTRALAQLSAKTNLPLYFSTETVCLDHLDQRQRKTYYSCARYLVLPEILQVYSRPIIVADIDQLVVRSLRPLLDAMVSQDVGLLRFQNEATNILALISATALVLNPTVGARHFCETIRNTLSGRMSDPAGFSWHLDQAALAVAHLVCDDVSFYMLPASVLDSTSNLNGVAKLPAEAAVFWSVTMSLAQNVAKLTSPSFKQFLRSDH